MTVRSGARRASNVLRRLVSRLTPPGPVILMYHRIAAPAVDPWGLSVSPDNFRSQLGALRRHRQPMAMNHFVSLLEAGRLPNAAVGITFDDGYVDNLRLAKPLLEDAGVPATVFIATGWIGARDLFWWDELAQLILLSSASIDVDITVGEERFVLRAGMPVAGEPRSTWRAWEPAETEREQLYVDLWQRLQRLDAAFRDEMIRLLREQLNGTGAAADDLPMTRAELATLPSKLVSIGGHARTHQPLTSMTVDRQRDEIEDSRDVCAQVTSYPIAGFAYPHGDADEATRAEVKAAGYLYACSTHSAAVRRTGYDLFDLPRVMAMNVDGAALLASLRQA